jgi:hypothetical protein
MMNRVLKQMRGKLEGQVGGKLEAKLDANRALDHDLQSNFTPTWVFNLLQVAIQVGSKVEPKLGYRETP